MTIDNAPGKNKRYSAIKTHLFIAGLLSDLFLLLLFQSFLSSRIAAVTAFSPSGFYMACFLYATFFFSFMYVFSLPLRLFSSFFIEHAFGLSNQKFPDWLVDEIKSVLMTYFLLMSAALVFYYLLRTFNDLWWLALALLWLFFSVVLARLFPVLILPVFYKYIAIDDRSLVSELVELGRRAGVRVIDICKIDLSRKTKKANAALVGVGGAKKIILGDTLMEKFTNPEIAAVVAHEMAHLKFAHIWKLLFFSGITTALVFFTLSRAIGPVALYLKADGITDLSIFPVLVLFISFFSLLIMPLQNYFCRRLEKQADREAIRLTGEPGVFISVMEKLSEMNLSDKYPGAIKKIFLYDHPPIGERIETAKRSLSARI
ncbi:MAG: M48 family metalloprotease [Candidatus Omnitrophica bacterium]|nr:M48 family metalloprotease [Candidatus Omnitrophota bacterium]